jgi:predicted signal transduction protein with EAL and GGDEF domain
VLVIGMDRFKKINEFYGHTFGDELPEVGSERLRSAKAAGPGTVYVFDAAMEERTATRHALVGDLRKALLLHQFWIHYQPQIDIRTKALIGLEALLRWRHPRLGLISPGHFIPLAERPA